MNLKPDSATWQLLGVLHKLKMLHVPASRGRCPDSMSNSKSSAKRGARRLAGAQGPQLSSPPARELCLCQAAVLRLSSAPLWVPFCTQLPSAQAQCQTLF